jgi:hypothetical protein
MESDESEQQQKILLLEDLIFQQPGLQEDLERLKEAYPPSPQRDGR